MGMPCIVYSATSKAKSHPCFARRPRRPPEPLGARSGAMALLAPAARPGRRCRVPQNTSVSSAGTCGSKTNHDKFLPQLGSKHVPEHAYQVGCMIKWEARHCICHRDRPCGDDLGFQRSLTFSLAGARRAAERHLNVHLGPPVSLSGPPFSPFASRGQIRV